MSLLEAAIEKILGEPARHEPRPPYMYAYDGESLLQPTHDVQQKRKHEEERLFVNQMYNYAVKMKALGVMFQTADADEMLVVQRNKTATARFRAWLSE